jgi:cytochrome c553
MECHRFNGHGEMAFRSSPLIGFQDWYLVLQMEKYRDGLRGGEDKDADGIKMHRIAETMTQEQLTDIAAHIAELAEKFADWVPRRERRDQQP